jgi:DNA-binding Xre family transcriptional regulator
MIFAPVNLVPADRRCLAVWVNFSAATAGQGLCGVLRDLSQFGVAAAAGRALCGGFLKRDLCKVADVSPTTMAKLGKGESVNVDILLRICEALEVDISDIMEVVPAIAEGD